MIPPMAQAADTARRVVHVHIPGQDAGEQLREWWAWLHSEPTTKLQAILVLLYLLAWLPFVVAFARRLTRWASNIGREDLTAWVATAPTTNLRLLIGTALGVIYVLGGMLAGVLGFTLALEMMAVLGTFILAMMGLATWGYKIKRDTFAPEAMGMTRESVNPNPPQPAADIVAATGQPAVPAQPPVSPDAALGPVAPAPAPDPAVAGQPGPAAAKIQPVAGAPGAGIPGEGG